ncbi:hypothetical protein NP233_g8989 [Leucocoprinus birnbaumii]|uniref:Ketopantoate reductase N-terminal domain-containing protein n=1 Tax=Leucocoprinus birnbaumii TaxID=56174 RepID=A0AAD5VPW4_9AGAR|nr:hypothetical protein NP233_g8989 [Leucocoprinus birnbaumii]
MPPSARLMKEILLVGSGVVGATYAYRLSMSGMARVTIVARSNYDAINFCRSVADAADQPYSYVFVTTKAIPDVTATPDILRLLVSPPYADLYPQPTYLLLQNGLNVEKDLYEVIRKLGKGSPNIISTTLWFQANLLGPNVVEHGSVLPAHLGEEEVLQDLQKILSSGGGTATVVPEIQRAKFQKNSLNVVVSSLATLTGYLPPAVWRSSPAGSGVPPYEPFVFDTTRHLIEEYTLQGYM